MRKRKRDLSGEDKLLWAHVARSAKPMPGRTRAFSSEVGTGSREENASKEEGAVFDPSGSKDRSRPELPETPKIEDEAAPASLAQALPAPSSPKIRTLPPLTGLDRRLKRDISRGTRAIEARIDLHGMRQAEAHRALLAFLYRAHHEGLKVALVITGKGGGLDARGEERGVLRRLVPHWLADPAMRRIVLGYEIAAQGHGGEGALYVRLRRDRAHHT